MQVTRTRTRWIVALLAASACGLLASCTGAAVGLTGPVSTAEPLMPTAAELAWERTGFPVDQRPEVEAVRLVSIFEQPEVIAGCLRAAGYPRALAVNGVVEPGEVADELRGSLALSTYVCQAQYPADPMFDRALRASQVGELYRYRANEQRECLQQLGHAIAVPPSERSFLERYPDRGGWNPINSVPASAFDAAVSACPLIPAGLADETSDQTPADTSVEASDEPPAEAPVAP